MPTGVNIKVGTNILLDTAGLDELRSSLLSCVDLELDDFKNGCPFQLLEVEDIPTHIIGAKKYIYDLGLIYPYFDEGYQRGNPIMFVELCVTIETTITDAVIWYGHDVDDSSLEVFCLEKRERLISLYQTRSRNKRANMGSVHAF